MDPQAQAKTDLITLNADIGQLERKRDKILKDLELLNKSKAEAFHQHDQQIKIKKDVAEHWENEGKRFQTLCHLYSNSAEELSETIDRLEKERDQMIAKAQEEVQQIHDDAKNREEAVGNREANVNKTRSIVAKQQEDVIRAVGNLQVMQQKVKEEKAELSDQSGQLEIEREETKQAVAKAQVLLDDIDRQLAEKRMELQGLDTQIENKTRHAETIGKKAESQLAEVQRRENVVARKERGIRETIDKHNKKELWLADREATVGRAYRETIQRGGKVD